MNKLKGGGGTLGKNQNNHLRTAWMRFSLAAEVQSQGGLNQAPSDTASLLVGWICPRWNLRNRLFLVLSSLCCLLRIWPLRGQCLGAPQSLVAEWVFELNLPMQVSPGASLRSSIFSSAYGWLAATPLWLSVLQHHLFLWRLFVGTQKLVSGSRCQFCIQLLLLCLTSFKCSPNSYLLSPIALC